jgi:hypothetical protein
MTNHLVSTKQDVSDSDSDDSSHMMMQTERKLSVYSSVLMCLRKQRKRGVFKEPYVFPVVMKTGNVVPEERKRQALTFKQCNSSSLDLPKIFFSSLFRPCFRLGRGRN